MADNTKVGDVVCEFDRQNAHCIILRKVKERWLIVGTSSRVLGAWGPTPKNSVQRITVSLDVSTLQSFSNRFHMDETGDDYTALQMKFAMIESAAWD
jgi:hypothetical protein